MSSIFKSIASWFAPPKSHFTVEKDQPVDAELVKELVSYDTAPPVYEKFHKRQYNDSCGVTTKFL